MFIFSIFSCAHRSWRSGLKFALYQLEWAGDGVRAEVVGLIQQHGGQISSSLRETGITHIVCNSAVYK
jgi:hypothetical protein